MTREQTIEAIRVMQAWVDGKEVQPVSRTGTFWTSNKSPSWNWADEDFQIKPTKTLRPWTADEVPLGAWLRYKGNQQSIRFLIVSNMERGIAGYNTHWPYQALLDEMEHSLDGGKTWKPCGVEEESK